MPFAVTRLRHSRGAGVSRSRDYTCLLALFVTLHET
jgi:hypothetical protein